MSQDRDEEMSEGMNSQNSDFMDIDEFEEYEEDEGEYGSHTSGHQSQISMVQRSMTYQTMEGNDGTGRSGIAADMQEGAKIDADDNDNLGSSDRQAWPYSGQGVNIESSGTTNQGRGG